MIRFLIYLYTWLIIVDAVLSYIPDLKQQPWAKKIHQLVEYSVAPIRKLLPANDLPIDIAPLIVIVLLQIIIRIW